MVRMRSFFYLALQLHGEIESQPGIFPIFLRDRMTSFSYKFMNIFFFLRSEMKKSFGNLSECFSIFVDILDQIHGGKVILFVVSAHSLRT